MVARLFMAFRGIMWRVTQNINTHVFGKFLAAESENGNYLPFTFGRNLQCWEYWV